MNLGLINKLMSVLEASLSKLSRYDEGSFIGSILSIAVSVFIYLFYLNHKMVDGECFSFRMKTIKFEIRHGFNYNRKHYSNIKCYVYSIKQFYPYSIFNWIKMYYEMVAYS